MCIISFLFNCLSVFFLGGGAGGVDERSASRPTSVACFLPRVYATLLHVTCFHEWPHDCRQVKVTTGRGAGSKRKRENEGEGESAVIGLGGMPWLAAVRLATGFFFYDSELRDRHRESQPKRKRSLFVCWTGERGEGAARAPSPGPEEP